MSTTGKAPRKATPLQLERREQLIEYLSRPDLEHWPKRKDYFAAIGAPPSTNPYTYFTTQEISDMEEEALRRKRARCSSDLVRVDKALLDKALTGDTAAIKLFYQRFDGFVEQRKLTGAVALQHEDQGLTRALEDMFNRLRDRTRMIDSQPASRLPLPSAHLTELDASLAGHDDGHDEEEEGPPPSPNDGTPISNVRGGCSGLWDGGDA